jgi:hypothetical protein
VERAVIKYDDFFMYLGIVVREVVVEVVVVDAEEAQPVTLK